MLRQTLTHQHRQGLFCPGMAQCFYTTYNGRMNYDVGLAVIWVLRRLSTSFDFTTLLECVCNMDFQLLKNLLHWLQMSANYRVVFIHLLTVLLPSVHQKRLKLIMILGFCNCWAASGIAGCLTLILRQGLTWMLSQSLAREMHGQMHLLHNFG